jgi:nucleotide-binding universal stress UspA family protein
MLPIRTILHATDFSDSSNYALEAARALARDYHAHLIALHVEPPPTMVYTDGFIPPDLGRRDEFARAELERLPLPEEAERRFEEGDPADAIVRAAEETHADLLVLGTHGRTGLGRLLMGSVAEKVMRKAPCPVLTVRTPFREGIAEPTPRHDAAVHATTA